MCVDCENENCSGTSYDIPGVILGHQNYRWVNRADKDPDDPIPTPKGRYIWDYDVIPANHPSVPFYKYRPVKRYVLGCNVTELARNYETIVEQFINGETFNVCLDDGTCEVEHCFDDTVGYSTDMEGFCSNGSPTTGLCSEDFSINSEPIGYKYSNYFNNTEGIVQSIEVECQDSLIYSPDPNDCNFIDSNFVFEYVDNPILYPIPPVSDEGNQFIPGDYPIQTCCPTGETFSEIQSEQNYHMGLDVDRYLNLTTDFNESLDRDSFVDKIHVCCLDENDDGSCDNPNQYTWFCRDNGSCGNYDDCECPNLYIESFFTYSTESYGCTYESAVNFYDQAVCTISVNDGGCGGECVPGICPIIDDGSCVFTSYGCTDVNANNYQPGILYDDGSCLYSEPENSIIFKNKFFDNLPFTESVISNLQNIKYGAVIYKINNEFINNNDVMFIELEEQDCDNRPDSGTCHKPIGGYFDYGNNDYLNLNDSIDYFYVIIDGDIEADLINDDLILSYDDLKPLVYSKDFTTMVDLILFQ